MRIVLTKREKERGGDGERMWNEGYALVKALKLFGVVAESELLRTMDTTEAVITVTFELPAPEEAILAALSTAGVQER